MKHTELEIVNCACGGRAHLVTNEGLYSVRCEFDPGLASAPEFTTGEKAVANWNNRQIEMSDGDVDAVCAYHQGKSYGEYMASKPQQERAVRFPKRTNGDIKEELCKQCGMPIPASVRSTKYCCGVCADAYRQKQKKLRESLGRLEYLRLHGPKCVICGEIIPCETRRKKYCSEACANTSQARKQKAAHAAKKRNTRFVAISQKNKEMRRSDVSALIGAFGFA